MSRGLTAAEAAAHCGISEGTFRATVGAAVPPMRFRGSVRWDKRAIDRYLDQLNGLDVSSSSDAPKLRRPGDVRASEAPSRG